MGDASLRCDFFTSLASLQDIVSLVERRGRFLLSVLKGCVTEVISNFHRLVEFCIVLLLFIWEGTMRQGLILCVVQVGLELTMEPRLTSNS